MKQLGPKFKITDLKPIFYYQSVKILDNNNKIMVIQIFYFNYLISAHQMWNLNPASITIIENRFLIFGFDI